MRSPVVTQEGIRYNRQVKTQRTRQVSWFVPLPTMVIWGVALGLCLLVVGCSRLNRDTQSTTVQPIPLTPVVWYSPSVTTTEISYHNACGETASLPVADAVREAAPKKMSGVFTAVEAQSQSNEKSMASDGVLEVGMAFRRIDLTIPKRSRGTYPGTVTIGLEMVFLARDGTLLFSKKLEGIGHGTVEVGDQSCDVGGVDAIVRQAIDSAIEGLAQQVGQSVQIREYAAQRNTWVPLATHPRPEGVVPTPGADAMIVPPSAARGVVEQPQAKPIEPVHPTQVNFRAIIRDENRDQTLEPNESLTFEIEVKNDGPVVAKDVVVVVEGNDALRALFPAEVPVGTLEPGEIKRLSITKQVQGTEEAPHGALTLTLRTAGSGDVVPRPKKFSFEAKSKHSGVASVPDVDQDPSSLAPYKRSKTVVIAIGIGAFRDEQLSPVKYAGRDAQMIAEYLRTIGGVPRDRVRVLRDEQALEQELEDLFAHWLRKRVDSDTTVYVFFAGRALVDGATGAVSLIPYDGTRAGQTQLYPIRRLQESLYRLPIRRAILMFDVSPEPSPGAELRTMPAPDWDSGMSEARKDVEMWMVGNRNLQDAHVYEPGKHGLFTYQLLRGLQGVADIDRDGTVTAGELCAYARSQVARVAQETFGNKQEALCMPPVGRGAMVRIHPVAKGNNPKPAPLPKQPEAPAGASGQVPTPMQVGP